MSVRNTRGSSDGGKASLLPTHSEDAPEKEGTHKNGLLSPEYATSSLVAGTAYCCISAAMVLLNKFALSGFDFTCPNTLLLLQCSTAVVFVKLAEMMGFWKLERLRWDIVQVRSLALERCHIVVYARDSQGKGRVLRFLARESAGLSMGSFGGLLELYTGSCSHSRTCCRYGCPLTYFSS